MITEYLNKRNSLREISDSRFESILPQLSSELSDVQFESSYSEQELLSDWHKLISWNSIGNVLNSTSRIGMKLCEHFFPNFYDIEDSKGNSFRKLWKDSETLTKVLRWNRKSHSTPYLSELKRGIYFCGGLPKSTMYRPQLAKMVTSNSSLVIDPCMGWGGRLLGTVSNGAHYIGFEPNVETFKGLNNMVELLGIQNKVTLINDSALNMEKYEIPYVEMILTSPPYFNLEVYSHEDNQSISNISSYTEWEQNFLKPVIEKFTSKLKDNGKSCWNVAKIGKHDMWKSINEIHSDLGFHESNVYQVQSSARQVNQIKSKNKKSVDKTVIFTKQKTNQKTSIQEKFMVW